VIDRQIARKKIFRNICRYLISDNIPESITSKDEEFKGAVNHLLLIVITKAVFRWLQGRGGT
jgi:hypothetical protein